MKYNVWDELILNVEDLFGYKEKVNSHLKVMIIGLNQEDDLMRVQYLCYIAPYMTIPYGFHTFKIAEHHQRYYGFDKKFLGDTGCFITAVNSVYKHMPAPEGRHCDHCNEFFEGAYLEEDTFFLCRACKLNPYR